MNYLTTLFDLCVDDKTAQTATKHEREHTTKCADNQETRLVVGTNKELAVLRVRGDGQHNTMREVTLDEDRHKYRTAHVRGMTSTPRCAM